MAKICEYYAITADGGLTRKKPDDRFKDCHGIDRRLPINRICEQVYWDLVELLENKCYGCAINRGFKIIHNQPLTYEIELYRFFNMAEFRNVLDDIREYEKRHNVKWNFQYNSYHKWITIWFGDFPFTE